MPRQRALVVGSVLLGLSLLTRPGNGNVSLKNGNFFIGYSDVSWSGGLELKIERVYNSKSSYHGMFGFGWGSDYEVHCTQHRDGSIVVHENGGGAQNDFWPEAPDTARVEAAVTAMAESARQASLVDGDPAEYRRRLQSDARFRHDEENKIRDAKGSTLAAPASPAVGTKLVSQKFGRQLLEVVADGYQRAKSEAQSELFDKACRLRRMQDRNTNFIEFTYREGERSASGGPEVASIKDNAGHRLDLTWQEGHVTKVATGDGRSATYQYKGPELVRSVDVEGNAYTYAYDPEGRHNLVGIGYSDNTRMDIAYNPRWRNETVYSVRDRDGSVTYYGYYGQGPGGRRFGTGAETFGTRGELVTSSRYDYTEDQTSTGQRFTRRMVQVIDGDRVETEYQAGGLPTRILRGDDVTVFAYDAHGHVTFKKTPTETRELTYDARSGKVASVITYPNGQRDKGKGATYQYDERGNLVHAKSTEGKAVSIAYDDRGRILTLDDGSGKLLRFEYNAESRPVKITKDGVGAIKVEYTASGDIKKVDSDGGRSISLAVTSAFQELLDLIRPAGVTLSF